MTENPGAPGGFDAPAAGQVPAQEPPLGEPAPSAPRHGSEGPSAYPPPDYPPPAYPPPDPAYQAPMPAAGQSTFPPADGGAQPWAAPAPQNSPQNTMGGFDPANLQNFDPKSVNPLDWALIGAGLLTGLLSFFAYYTYTVHVNLFGVNDSSSVSVSAWHGFFGWFAALVAVAAAVVLAMSLIAKMTLPFPIRLAVLGGFALALLCTLLALVIVPGRGGNFGGVSLDKGHGFSYWLSLLLLLGATAVSFMRFQQTGGKLPGKISR